MRLGRFDTRRVLGRAGRAVLLTALACALIGCDTPRTERLDETVPPGRHAQRSSNPFLPSATDDPGWPFIRGSDYDGRSAEINLPNRGRPPDRSFSGRDRWVRGVRDWLLPAAASTRRRNR